MRIFKYGLLPKDTFGARSCGVDRTAASRTRYGDILENRIFVSSKSAHFDRNVSRHALGHALYQKSRDASSMDFVEEGLRPEQSM